jgi:glutamate formiminotransferase/formiminotetrahydrofolate cyclodeaminase
MDAFKLPKGSDEEKKIRKEAVQSATRYAIEVPFRVMEVSLKSMDLLMAMVKEGNPNSITDAGVGALCARTAVLGAHMNVRINAAGFQDKVFLDDILARAKRIEEEAIRTEQEIIERVNQQING